MEMTLWFSGRMLTSYFSRQQQRSRSSLFDTSTSFCCSYSRSCRAPILDPLKTFPRKGKKKMYGMYGMDVLYGRVQLKTVVLLMMEVVNNGQI